MKSFIFLLLILFSQQVFSESRVWMYRGTGAEGVFPACQLPPGLALPFDKRGQAPTPSGCVGSTSQYGAIVERIEVGVNVRVVYRTTRGALNDYLTYRDYLTNCPAGTELNQSTNRCEEEKICEPDLNLGQVSWSRLVHGMRPSFCAAGCLSRPRDIVCTDDSCSATAVTIGQKCEQGQEDGIYPTDPNEPDPEEPVGPPHIPDPNEPDPSDPSQPHQPTDPTKPIEGGGGVVANPSVPPVNPNPTNPLPDPTAPGNGDVVAAVVNMNRDMNKAMDNLALSVNKSSADTLQMINAGTEGVKTQIAQLENTQIQIYENEKALMLALNSDVVNAVNTVSSTVGGLGDSISSAINESIGESMGSVSDSIAGLTESVTGLGDSLGSINEGVAGIGETLDALANFDSSGVTICGEGPCPEGFYKSQYNDGFAGVFDENFNLMKEIVTQGVVEVFGTIDLSNAAPPSFCMTLWMYGNFCFTDHINLDWIFTFIRAAFMFTTIFYSRKLIIGG